MGVPNMPPRRSDDDGPLATVFMLVLLIGAVGGAIWLSVRDQTMGDSRGLETHLDPGAATQLRGGGRSGTEGFEEAFKHLPVDADAAERSADAEYDGLAQRLDASELAEVKKVMSRSGGSRDDYGDSDLAMLRRRGFDTWVRAREIRWSYEDPSFKPAARTIWNRSPRVRKDGELIELAVRWSEKNRSARSRIIVIIEAIEHETRELTSGERDAINSFAGDEYFSNRQ
jgi:hypothetical protein